eukprot:GHVU01217051.1.p1 GENE.GHVU01217051.1~~GHVU01217051.1.p1  ORF type:complete len:123 (-),score=6.91 GHVU01217051.1:1386-1754(-)
MHWQVKSHFEKRARNGVVKTDKVRKAIVSQSAAFPCVGNLYHLSSLWIINNSRPSLTWYSTHAQLWQAKTYLLEPSRAPFIVLFWCTHNNKNMFKEPASLLRIFGLKEQDLTQVGWLEGEGG